MLEGESTVAGAERDCIGCNLGLMWSQSSTARSLSRAGRPAGVESTGARLPGVYTRLETGDPGPSDRDLRREATDRVELVSRLAM